jgi:type VI secretion system secreted protein VgrG
MTTSDTWVVTARVESPLGDGVLHFQSLRGEERIGEVYEYVLDVWTVDRAVTFADLAGSELSVRLHDGATERRINGTCMGLEEAFSSVPADEPGVRRAYRLRLRPWFALHGRVRDSRVFEFGEQSPKPASEVFVAVAGESDATSRLGGSIKRGFGRHASLVQVHASGTPPRPLYVQYRETNLDFLARLLERDGLTWWFEHTDRGQVKVHLGNQPAHFPDVPGEPLRFYGEKLGDGTEGIARLRRVAAWEPGEHVGLAHDWTSTGDDRSVSQAAGEPGAHGDWRRFDTATASFEPEPELAPAKLADLVATRAEAAAARMTRLEGEARSHRLIPGSVIRIRDMVSGGAATEHLVVAARLEVESRESYGDAGDEDGVQCHVHGTFEAVPADVPYRPEPRTPEPSPAGPQTATVVGLKDEEITSDRDLRVQVRFHWDVRTKDDEHRCWVRVAQPLAGAGFGTHFLPRHGMEVVVDFVDGRVDRPIVTGCVYDGRNGPAFPMPDSSNLLGLRSRSTPDGNEETFSSLLIDDTAEKERMEVVAERDFRREVGNDDVLEVGLVHKDKGDQTVTIHNDRTVTLNEGSDTLAITKGDRTVTIEEGGDALTVKKDRTVTVEGSLVADAGKKVTITAGDELVLECGSASITLKSSGDVTIKGANLALTGTGDVDLEATGNCTAKGMKVKVDGTMTEVAGSATTKITGGMVNIN